MIQLIINKKSVLVAAGSSVATAVFESDAQSFRQSVSGEPRFPLCGMGICFECRVTINGAEHQRSCQILAEDGMKIETK